jgi:hypothetical protein
MIVIVISAVLFSVFAILILASAYCKQLEWDRKIRSLTEEDVAENAKPLSSAFIGKMASRDAEPPIS